MNAIKDEIEQLRQQADTILNRLDELTLAFDDPYEKLAMQRCVNKLNDAVCDLILLSQ